MENSSESTSSPTKTTITRLQGQKTDLTENTKIVSGSVKIGNGAIIDTKGKTIGEVIDEINAQGQNGITAMLKDGRFTIESTQGRVNITSEGDFSRVTGIASYTVGNGTTTNVSPIKGSIIQGANTITGTETSTNGTIQIGSGAVIDTKGKTLNEVITAINAQNQSGITAEIKDGKFTINSESGTPTISATGDFARISGLANYTVQGPTYTNTPAETAYLYQGESVSLTGNEYILQGSIKIGNSAEINANGKTLNQIINEINAQGQVTASITDGKFSILSSSTTTITTQGDLARVTGLNIYEVDSCQKDGADGSYVLAIQQGANASLSGTENILNGTIQIGSGSIIDTTGKTINEVIAEINAQGIEDVTAELRDGKFTIISKNTPVAINASGDFARVTGLSDYTVVAGQTSGNPAQTYWLTQGAVSTLTGSEKALSGTIKVGTGAEIDTTGKSINEVISEINAQNIDGVTAEIRDGKFSIVSDSGSVTVTATGDVGRITGLTSYTTGAGSYTNQAGTLATITQGSSFGLTGDENVLSGTIQINSGSTINTQGKTLNQIIDEINELGIEGITASIRNRKFTISGNGTYTVTATGDMARVTGLASYSVNAPTISQSEILAATVTQGATTGLTGSEKAVSGSIQIGTYGTIDTKGKTLNQIITEINALSTDITASITDGKFTIEDTNSSPSTITASGDFARVTGMADYVVGSGTTNTTGPTLEISFLDSIPTSVSVSGVTLITTAEDLKKIANNKSGTYILAADIDMTGVDWTPITSFKGTLEGWGHTIKNLNIDNTIDESYTGLFNTIEASGIVKNLKLENVTINGSQNTGGIAGYNQGIITNCTVSGTVTGSVNVGGISGYNTGTISRCLATDIIVQGATTVGGIVGNNFGTIKESGSIASVEGGSKDAGGIAGQNENVIENVFSSSSIHTLSNCGGLIGYNSGYLRCSWSNSTLNCGGLNVGGIVGYNSGNENLTYNLFDSDKAGTTTLGGGNASSFSSINKAVTSEQMQNRSTYDMYLYDSVWDLTSTFPPLFVNTTKTYVYNSILTGAVDTRELSGEAFYGQQSGILSFSNGTDISISATDNLSTIIQKLNNNGFNAYIGDDGKLNIQADTENLQVTNDTSGVAKFYGISSGTDNTYYASSTQNTTYNYETTITGSVDTRNFDDSAFYGQNSGTIRFSNGIDVDINSTDSRTDVLSKLNAAGINAYIDSTSRKIVLNCQGENVSITSDTSTFTDFYGLNAAKTYTGSQSSSVEQVTKNSSTLTGAVDTRGLGTGAFSGQTTGTLTFSNGTTVNISATDDLNTVLQKINAIEDFSAEIDSNGRISITASNNDQNLQITSDTSGFADFYGLGSGKTYTGSQTTTEVESAFATSKITGSVDTRNMADSPFYGQQNGILTFSNGTTVSISSTDTRTQIIEKLNNAGFTAEIDSNGRITISMQGIDNLNITSDTSGFADFYGLNGGKVYNGAISNSEENIVDKNSKIIGSVNTNLFADSAFHGQQNGVLTFSDGTTVNILATDKVSDVIAKINAQGLNAYVDADGHINIESDSVDNLDITSDTSGFSDYYGLLSRDTIYSGSTIFTTGSNHNSSSTIKGSVDTRNFSGNAFYGQTNGTITFSDGTTVSISASDSLNTVLQKINNAGLLAEISTDGKIVITADGVENIKINTDTSGFSDFYGLKGLKTYSGISSITEVETTPGSSTLTGALDTRLTSGEAFYGLKTGTLKFSDGTSVSIDSTDSLDSVIAKINAAGLNAKININGKISITSSNQNLRVSSDDTGFADFYGLNSSSKTYSGSITTTRIRPDGSDIPSVTPGAYTEGAIRLQIGTSPSDALYIDTKFSFDDFFIDLTDENSTMDSLDRIDDLLKLINNKSTNLGILQNRLESIISGNDIKIENLSAAYSTIMDADIAEESSNFVQAQIRQQTSVALLTQSQNVRAAMIMQLIS